MDFIAVGFYFLIRGVEIVPDINETSKTEFSEAKKRVEIRSDGLRKEIRWTDAVLLQILIVIQLESVGVAALEGQSPMIFLLLAAALFLIPLAATVGYLGRIMPLEGGLYQWAKIGFGERTGFIVGWNYYFSGIIYIPLIAVAATTHLSYLLPELKDVAKSRWSVLLINFTGITLSAVVSVFSLRITKRLYNFSSIVKIVVILLLCLLPLLIFIKGEEVERRPFTLAMPVFSLMSLNILSKLAFGAFSGFEEIAILAGEYRNARRTLARSIYVAAPVVTLLYVLAANSVVMFISPQKDIDLVATVSQVLEIALRPFGTAGDIILPLIISALLLPLLSVNSIVMTNTSRLPMTAGWDYLLPTWFTKLHSRYGTPVNSIIFSGVLAFLISLVLTGDDSQETFQLQMNASYAIWAITYLIMFALPVIGLRNLRFRPNLGLRIISTVGFLITLLFIIFSFFPIIDVSNSFLFTLKIFAVVMTVNITGIGVFLYIKKQPKR